MPNNLILLDNNIQGKLIHINYYASLPCSAYLCQHLAVLSIVLQEDDHYQMHSLMQWFHPVSI